MNAEMFANAVIKAGVMLLESGAETYRVEDTMNRLCLSRPEVSQPQSYVTDTGIMLSFEASGHVITRIARVKQHKTNLLVVDEINQMSRSARNLSSGEIMARLREIEQGPVYPFWMQVLMSGLGAGGFAIFFHGNLTEALLSGVIGVIMRLMIHAMNQTPINGLLTSLVAAFAGTLFSVLFSYWVPEAEASKMVISSIMLLAPGLAMTNAIRDTVSGDYLSGLSRGTEALLTATAIAAGSALVLLLVK